MVIIYGAAEPRFASSYFAARPTFLLSLPKSIGYRSADIRKQSESTCILSRCFNMRKNASISKNTAYLAESCACTGASAADMSTLRSCQIGDDMSRISGPRALYDFVFRERAHHHALGAHLTHAKKARKSHHSRVYKFHEVNRSGEQTRNDRSKTAVALKEGASRVSEVMASWNNG